MDSIIGTVLLWLAAILGFGAGIAGIIERRRILKRFEAKIDLDKGLKKIEDQNEKRSFDDLIRHANERNKSKRE